MLSSISPYELLRASKPKPVQTVTTDYDLYSLSQNRTPPSHQNNDTTTSSYHYDTSASSESAVNTPQPSRRTHYIKDIHIRHNSALRANQRKQN